MELPNSKPKYTFTQEPRTNVLDYHHESDASYIIVLCRAVQFQITVLASYLESTSFEAEYLRLIEQAEEDDSGLSDQDWYYPRQVHRFQLRVVHDTLQAVPVKQIDPSWTNTLIFPTRKLPPSRRIPRVKAADLQIIPVPSQSFDAGSGIPSQARMKNGGSVRYFKPAVAPF
ncbi:hypothetical protein AJ80_03789 [Polytolypa hystricis UAMH7299]|uniref:Uncharacterized protein n=1 Tax=Polytolypa hystricis (strain UAMH7299) TaxID=1447883 RepID=A0A2B7YG60_POLH7|nr:hypothetical protein AJ80_03789 [Polytolypa hystricis UAMH7299]